ncbi:MAG: hypothetical protein ABEJ04_07465 [Halobacteriaceae archaeon]
MVPRSRVAVALALSALLVLSGCAAVDSVSDALSPDDAPEATATTTTPSNRTTTPTGPPYEAPLPTGEVVATHDERMAEAGTVAVSATVRTTRGAENGSSAAGGTLSLRLVANLTTGERRVVQRLGGEGRNRTVVRYAFANGTGYRRVVVPGRPAEYGLVGREKLEVGDAGRSLLERPLGAIEFTYDGETTRDGVRLYRYRGTGANRTAGETLLGEGDELRAATLTVTADGFVTGLDYSVRGPENSTRVVSISFDRVGDPTPPDWLPAARENVTLTTETLAADAAGAALTVRGTPAGVESSDVAVEDADGVAAFGGARVSRPVQVAVGSEVTRATLSLSYEESTVPGGNESALAVYRYEGYDEEFVRVGGTVDAADDSVRAQVAESGTYVVLHGPTYRRVNRSRNGVVTRVVTGGRGLVRARVTATREAFDEVSRFVRVTERGEAPDYERYREALASRGVLVAGTDGVRNATLRVPYDGARDADGLALYRYDRRSESYARVGGHVNASAGVVVATVSPHRPTVYAVLHGPTYRDRRDELTRNVTRTVRAEEANASLTATGPRYAFDEVSVGARSAEYVNDRAAAYADAAVTAYVAAGVPREARNATLRLRYDPGEVPGGEEGDLAVYRATYDGFERVDGATVDAGSDVALVRGLEEYASAYVVFHVPTYRETRANLTEPVTRTVRDEATGAAVTATGPRYAFETVEVDRIDADALEANESFRRARASSVVHVSGGDDLRNWSVSLAYDAANVSGSESDLAVYRYDAADEAFVRVGGTVDAAADRVALDVGERPGLLVYVVLHAPTYEG